MEGHRLPSVHDTAYPRLKSYFSEDELSSIFTPTAEDIALAHSVAKSTGLRIAFLVLLKTFQRLGYFPPLHKVPRQVAERISLLFGVHYDAVEWTAYDASGSRYRHIDAVRKHLGVKSFSDMAVKLRQRGVTQASKYNSALRMPLMCLESRPDERARATTFH